MRSILSPRVLRGSFAAYLLAVTAVTVVYGWHNARAASDWAIGEWLINYSAGFVRRGLPGEAILLLSRVSAVSPIYLALGLQLLVFAIVFLNVFRLTRDVRWSLPLLAVLLSPATLAFHVLDPPAGFRKEILLFAGLSGLVLALVSRRWRPWTISALLGVTAEICVLSHEPLVLYLPYLFGAVFLAMPEPRRALRICLLPAALAAVTVVTCARHPGTPAMAATICSSVGGTLTQQNYGVCGGAILYLSRSLDYARGETVIAADRFRYGRLYGVTGALALAPFALLFRKPQSFPGAGGNARQPRLVLLLTFLCAAIGSSVLFVVATDWGRWIYIHAVCLMLLALLLERRDGSVADGTDGIRLTPATSVLLTAVVVYATLWTLPHFGLFPGRFGYPDLLHYLLHYHQAG